MRRVRATVDRLFSSDGKGFFVARVGGATRPTRNATNED
jgi:hypothetical protein